MGSEMCIRDRAIARGIVEVHRGAMWVEDTPGGGATFVITLPQESA